MISNRRLYWMRKGLNTGLTLVLLLLTLAPVGKAGVQAETAQWDLTTGWRLPFLRSDHSAIYDAPNDRIIVFGGWNGRQFFNDVWALDTTEGSEAWTKLNPDSAWPPSRGQHTAIYDAANQRMIIFGGHSFHYNFDDVWALDLTPGAETWTELSPTGLPIGARRYHGAVYDATNEWMVVFGGSGWGGLRNDTWALDLTPGAEAWRQLAVTGSVPPTRWQHTAIYDSENGLMVVFGGSDGSALRNDAWALNLTTLHWAELSPAGDPPPARRKHSAVFQNPFGASTYGWMIVFGGLGNGGFLNDVWYLDLTPGEIEWFQAAPPSSPAVRAGHAAAHVMRPNDYRMVVLGGRGMGSLAGETQWVYDVPTVIWSPLTPDLPSWGQGGRAAQGIQNNGRPDVTLEIEDAPPDTTVNVLPNQEVWFVTKIKTSSSTYNYDIDVTLDVVAPKFDVVQVGTRYKDALEVTGWITPTSLGGGRYRLEDVDLEKRGSDSKYQMQVVFKANVKADAPTGRTQVNVVTEGPNWPNSLEYNAYAVIRQNPRAWIITNRTQLFDQYDNGEVRSLLDKVFEIAQGGAEYNNSPPAVVLYADRYVPALEDWDNTAVDYDSENTANQVANEVADWLVNWVVDWNPPMTFAYPNYLVILGDDNIIPRYRKDDYDDIISEDEYPNIWGLEPVLDELVGHDYFWTDNPYGDRQFGTVHQDWEEGGLEAAVGRIVGGSAQDMRKALRYGVRGPNPNEDRAIIASDDTDCFDWDIPGPDAVSTIVDDLGYAVNLSFVDGGPTKAEIVGEMEDGFAIAALAHHGEVTAWETPGDGDHLWCYEVPEYDPHDKMPANRPYFYFDACRVGLTYGSGWDDPAVPEDGPQAYDDGLVYGLVHQGISGVVASGGLMYLYPGNNDVCCGETLSNDFWNVARAHPDRSDPLGWSLMRAKSRFSIGSDFDRKTVQTFTYFGMPWMRLPGHASARMSASAISETDETSPFWSTPALSYIEGPAAPDATYVVTANVDASTYATSTTVEGFDLIEVDGLSQRTENGQVVLPQATLELVLPLSATITSLVFTPTQDVVLPDLDIPTILVGVGIPGGSTGGYTTTVGGIYPVTATFESRLLDTYQLVRVNVVPVTYDATADQATLYRNVDIRVEYDTPQTIALTYFEPDEIQYVPGDTISTTATLVNAGDVAETVTATLIIQDAQGQIVGFQGSGAFDIPAGGSYDLSLGWTGPLDGDVYLARLFVWQSGDVVAGAGREVFVTAGEIADLTIPGSLLPGQTGTFTMTFENHSANTSMALASLVIYDADDTLVAFLEPQAAIVPGGGSATPTFSWTPDSPGTYVASVVVAAGGQEYGPASQSFDVAYTVYLPLVLRSYQ